MGLFVGKITMLFSNIEAKQLKNCVCHKFVVIL